MFVNRKMIEQVPMFENASEKFLGAILVKLRPLIGLPGSYIIRAGELGSEMFFISKGKVSVMVDINGVYTKVNELRFAHSPCLCVFVLFFFAALCCVL